MDETGESGFRPYAIIYMVVVTLFLYFISSYIAYRRDSKELKQCKIFYLEQPKSTGIAYCFSFTVNKRFCDDKEQDLVFRLGGAKNNGPLLHFRDFDNNLFQSGQVVNIGFYLPVDIGDLENIEIACVNNNNSNDDGNDLLSISHIAVRKFQKINCDDSAALDFMPKHIRTWQQDFTGAKSKHCEKAILQAGQTKSFYLEEIQQFGQDSLVKFMWQHYLFSMSTKWHQVWSEYSCLDYMLVMCLDVLAITAIISTYYAYGQQACSFNINMNDVSSYERTTNWLDENWTCLVSISWMSLTCSLSIIPLSMIWWRLFQFIGGKGFTDNLLKSYLEKCNDDYENNKTDFLILRTLESKSVYEDTCMTTKRLLREEPVITNCSTDDISLHNLAYVRTKMGQTVLQGDEPDRKIVKRSNYVSAGGKPNIMSGSKFGMDGTVSTNSSQYSERLVQQI
uniref:PLAT domain-containing protein n=1 Tax=Ciona intestinalis TaxID=7719 RepID=F7AQ68_CIOIN